MKEMIKSGREKKCLHMNKLKMLGILSDALSSCMSSISLNGEYSNLPAFCPICYLINFGIHPLLLSCSPESIKNRNDVFYLIPERSCVPDSPVWYSTGSLGLDAMTKMLNRLRVVREIQEAHLHYQAFYTG